MTVKNYQNCFLELIRITQMNRRKVEEKNTSSSHNGYGEKILNFLNFCHPIESIK